MHLPGRPPAVDTADLLSADLRAHLLAADTALHPDHLLVVADTADLPAAADTADLLDMADLRPGASARIPQSTAARDFRLADR